MQNCWFLGSQAAGARAERAAGRNALGPLLKSSRAPPSGARAPSLRGVWKSSLRGVCLAVRDRRGA
jgi:hypothetical protein